MNENKDLNMKKQEQEEWHNPERVPKRRLLKGWRFLLVGEGLSRLSSGCKIMQDSSWSVIFKKIGFDARRTYIVRIEDDTKPEPAPPSLPDSDSRTEFETGAVTKREQILRDAITCTTKDRQQTHGKPENSFADIGHLWSWYKDIQFSPQDVAVMMGLMKMARIKSNPIYDDNMVDCAGYIAIAAELGRAEG